MNIMDELKKLARPYDEDLDDDGLDLDQDTAADPAFARTAPAPDPVQPPMQEPEPRRPVSATAMGGMGSSMGAGGSTGGSSMGNMGGMSSMGSAAVAASLNHPDMAKYRVVLIKPEKFESATDIANNIRQGHAIILNCEDTNEAIARRIVDFLTGCAFALDGEVQKAANKVYIITPKSVGIQAEQEG